MKLMFRKKSREELDVDVRFLLANERTLLAWVRTGLTLIAGGVAVTFIAIDSRYGTIAGLGAIAFGGLLSLIGYLRYKEADSAIRNGTLPPEGMAELFVVAGVVLFAVALVAIKELHLF